MPAKTFKDKMQQKAINPTKQFISTPEPEEEPQPVEENTPKVSSTRTKISKETKSRRLQLLIRPSVYQAIKDMAEQEETSINNLINSILMDAVRK